MHIIGQDRAIADLLTDEAGIGTDVAIQHQQSICITGLPRAGGNDPAIGALRQWQAFRGDLQVAPAAIQVNPPARAQLSGAGWQAVACEQLVAR